MKRKFTQDPFALGGESEQDLPAVLATAPTANVAVGGQAIDQLDGAVVLNLQPLGNFPNAGPGILRTSFDGQHHLVLAGFQASAARCLLAEMQETTNLMTQIRQGLKIGRCESFAHVANYIV
jgi:hypothetical protein